MKAFTILCLLLISFSGYANEFKASGVVKATALRMRAGAGVNYEILGTLKKGSQVIVTEEKNGWYAISIPASANAWVARKYISPEGLVLKDNIRIRSGPDIVYSPIGTLAKSNIVKILDKSNQHWYKIQPPVNSIAWVKANFIEVTEKTPLSEQTGKTAKGSQLDQLFSEEPIEEKGELLENYEIVLAIETLIINEKELSEKTDACVAVLRKRFQAAKVKAVQTHRLTAGTILVHFDEINSLTLENLQELILKQGELSLHAVHKERPNGPKESTDKDYKLLAYRFEKKNLLLVNKKNERVQTTGIYDAYTTTHEFGRISIKFSLDEEAAYEYSNITGRFLKSPLAYVLDGEVLSAPIINSISSDSGSFSGDFNALQARNIAIMLRYGAIPVQLKIKSQQENGNILSKIKKVEKIIPVEKIQPAKVFKGSEEHDLANDDIQKVIPPGHTSYTGYLIPVKESNHLVDFALAKKVNRTYLPVCYIKVQTPISKKDFAKLLYKKVSVSGNEKFLSGWARPLLYLDDYNPVK